MLDLPVTDLSLLAASFVVPVITEQGGASVLHFARLPEQVTKLRGTPLPHRSPPTMMVLDAMRSNIRR